MVQINFTNIIVDDFSYGRRNPMQKYIYFLTHMHSDHYGGMSNGWNYGKIYCSRITRQILFNKFPGLQAEVIPLELDKPNRIVLNEENNIEITVYLFDANHCAGAVMFLFEGYMGRILHTGDIRFSPTWFYENKILYPDYEQKKTTKQSSIQIDELIFDNTFCDPVFKFPAREEVYNMIVEIILKNPNKRVLICIDSIGKEELVISLAEKFQTLVVVSEERFQAIRCMDFNASYFTTNRDEGWIEIIRKGDRNERLKNDPNTIAITATGWANCSKYISPDDRNYIVPYSLHSNYEEIELFVMSICPGILRPVVLQGPQKKAEKINNIVQFSSYMISLMHIKQRGLDFFMEQYQNRECLSENYRNFMENPEKQRALNRKLCIELSEEQISTQNSILFDQKYSNQYGKNRPKKYGASISQSVQLDDKQQDLIKYIKQKQDLKLKEIEIKKREIYINQVQEQLEQMNKGNEQKEFSSNHKQKLEKNKEDMDQVQSQIEDIQKEKIQLKRNFQQYEEESYNDQELNIDVKSCNAIFEATQEQKSTQESDKECQEKMIKNIMIEQRKIIQIKTKLSAQQLDYKKKTNEKEENNQNNTNPNNKTKISVEKEDSNSIRIKMPFKNIKNKNKNNSYNQNKFNFNVNYQQKQKVQSNNTYANKGQMKLDQFMVNQDQNQIEKKNSGFQLNYKNQGKQFISNYLQPKDNEKQFNMLKFEQQQQIQGFIQSPNLNAKKIPKMRINFSSTIENQQQEQIKQQDKTNLIKNQNQKNQHDYTQKQNKNHKQVVIKEKQGLFSDMRLVKLLYNFKNKGNNYMDIEKQNQQEKNQI